MTDVKEGELIDVIWNVGVKRLDRHASFTGAGLGTSASPFQITSWAQLQEMNDNVTAHYILMKDLDSSTTGYDTYASSSANAGDGWIPIGASEASPWNGNFDGNYKIISDLYINRSQLDVGFFGTLNGTVNDLGIEDANITNVQEMNGILAGRGMLGSTINNCYTSGSIESTSNTVGGATAGFVGQKQGGFISNSYSIASVTDARRRSGGFVGYHLNSGLIENSYFAGTTSGGGIQGGFIGIIATDGADSNCFWDNQTSGEPTSAGTAVGKTTADMKTQSTFTDAGWDFNNIWGMDSEVNDGYPFLMGFWPTGLEISLTSPEDIFISSTNQISFVLSITNRPGLGIKNVSLVIDDVIEQTNTSTYSGVYNFTEVLSDGNYDWKIIAYDDSI